VSGQERRVVRADKGPAHPATTVAEIQGLREPSTSPCFQLRRRASEAQRPEDEQRAGLLVPVVNCQEAAKG